MKKGSTLFLRLTLIALAIIVVTICIFITPEMVREARLGQVLHIVFPMILVMCVSTLPFLFGLVQGWKLLGYIDNNTAFSEQSIRALKRIKYAATAIAIMFATSLPSFYILAEIDDAPGLVVVGMIITSAPIVIAVFSALLQKLLRSAMTLQSENELTV